MYKSFPRVSWLALSLAWLATAPASAQVKPRAQLHVVRDVRLSDQDDAVRKSIVLRDGKVESIVNADAPIPPGARVIEADGALALPAFIDAYTHEGTETPTPEANQDKPVSTSSDVRVDMRQANRKGIAPAFRAIEALAFKEGKLGGYRGKGFGALLSAPHGQILSGTSVLVCSLDAATRDLVIDPDVFAHAGLRAGGGGGYPSTMMGSIAQMRQFFLDAHHQRNLTLRREEGRPGPRAPFDEDLAAGMPLLLREQRVVCEADRARDIERWLKLSGELGLDIAISGGREAWKHADTLAVRGVPVFLTLDWGDEVDDPHAKEKKKKKKKPAAQAEEAAAPVDSEAAVEPSETPEEEGEEGEEDEKKADDDEERWTYTEPMAVREERRREWEETRDCAMRLSEAGVAFAFGSGRKSPADLLKSVRTLVEEGLPAEVAIAGLTSSAADLLGVGQNLGRIAPGFDASIALWTENPTGKDAQLAWLFIDGFPHEFEVKPKDEKKEGAGDGPAEGVDASGSWTLSVESEGESRPMTASLEMKEDGAVTGTLTSTNPMDSSEIEMDCSGSVSGNQLSLEANMSFGEFDMDIELTGEIDGDEFSGELLFKSPGGEFSRTATGSRTPQESSVGTEVRR